MSSSESASQKLRAAWYLFLPAAGQKRHPIVIKRLDHAPAGVGPRDVLAQRLDDCGGGEESDGSAFNKIAARHFSFHKRCFLARPARFVTAPLGWYHIDGRPDSSRFQRGECGIMPLANNVVGRPAMAGCAPLGATGRRARSDTPPTPRNFVRQRHNSRRIRSEADVGAPAQAPRFTVHWDYQGNRTLVCVAKGDAEFQTAAARAATR